MYLAFEVLVAIGKVRRGRKRIRKKEVRRERIGAIVDPIVVKIAKRDREEYTELIEKITSIYRQNPTLSSNVWRRVTDKWGNKLKLITKNSVRRGHRHIIQLGLQI